MRYLVVLAAVLTLSAGVPLPEATEDTKVETAGTHYQHQPAVIHFSAAPSVSHVGGRHVFSHGFGQPHAVEYSQVAGQYVQVQQPTEVHAHYTAGAAVVPSGVSYSSVHHGQAVQGNVVSSGAHHQGVLLHQPAVFAAAAPPASFHAYNTGSTVLEAADGAFFASAPATVHTYQAGSAVGEPAYGTLVASAPAAVVAPAAAVNTYQAGSAVVEPAYGTFVASAPAAVVAPAAAVNTYQAGSAVVEPAYGTFVASAPAAVVSSAPAADQLVAVVQAAVPTAVTYQSEHVVQTGIKEVQIPVQTSHVHVPVEKKVHYGLEKYVAGSTTSIHKPQLSAPAIAAPTVFKIKEIVAAPEVTVHESEVTVEQKSPNYVHAQYDAGVVVEKAPTALNTIDVPTPVEVHHKVAVAQPYAVAVPHHVKVKSEVNPIVNVDVHKVETQNVVTPIEYTAHHHATPVLHAVHGAAALHGGAVVAEPVTYHHHAGAVYAGAVHAGAVHAEAVHTGAVHTGVTHAVHAPTTFHGAAVHSGAVHAPATFQTGAVHAIHAPATFQTGVVHASHHNFIAPATAGHFQVTEGDGNSGAVVAYGAVSGIDNSGAVVQHGTGQHGFVFTGAQQNQNLVFSSATGEAAGSGATGQVTYYSSGQPTVTHKFDGHSLTSENIPFGNQYQWKQTNQHAESVAPAAVVPT